MMRLFFADEGGFTQIGVVVALLLTLALLTTSVQVYWINSEAGDIQFAADAGALAAENVVAEYYVIARTVDAAILSISLLGLTVYVISCIALVIPGGQTISTTLSDAGQSIVNFRNSFSRTSGKALKAIETALPFIAAVNAMTIINQNSNARASYQGLAIIFPLVGDTIFPEDDLDKSYDELEEEKSHVQEQSDEALSASDTMEDSKERAYQADCGKNPNYCLYERCDSLAGLSPYMNPFYSSADLWTFDNALERARAYYDARWRNEQPFLYQGSELGKSVARRALYGYAIEKLAQGYAYYDASGAFHGWFPTLPHNIDQIRSTNLYQEAIYPVSAEGYLHASSLCSACQATGAVGLGAVCDVENGIYAQCPVCDFSAETLGRVVSISHNATNGFEYYYEIIATEAERYQGASTTYEEETRTSRDALSDVFETFKAAAKELFSARWRIDPQPPGRIGCLSVAVDVSEHIVSHEVPLPFVSSDAVLRRRMAISGAKLIEDEDQKGDTLIARLLDGYVLSLEEGSIAQVVFSSGDIVLKLWSDMLVTYEQGTEGLAKGIEGALNAIPYVDKTPLGAWAKERFTAIIADLGLEPAKLGSFHAVTVNTGQVLQESGYGSPAALLRSDSELSQTGITILEEYFQDSGLSLFGFISENLRMVDSVSRSGQWQ